MHDLRVESVTDDGTGLRLRGAGGAEYRVAIDDRLRAALRGDRARMGQLEIAMESQLRPREIQARIRAGESAESVATAAGVPVERVRRYEGPVLREREHVAATAAMTAVGRHADGPAPRLGDLVASALEPRGVDVEGLEWDAWRRDDGRWTVALSYPLDASSRQARWIYDPAGRSVAPDDDEARVLCGMEPVGRRDAPPSQDAASRTRVRRRLAAVPADDGLLAEVAVDPTAPLLYDDTPEIEGRAGPSSKDTAPDDASDDVAASDEPPPAPVAEPVTPQRRTRRGRASVPSWDEILLGQRRTSTGG
jgi:Protein of unknown function (DUF3071)